jgi:hypothetical protein
MGRVHVVSHTIEPAELLPLRLRSLLLADRASRCPGEVVEWFGAMQAQDLSSAEWSFGVRSPGLTQADVHRATVDREILRTWPMRGTVHFVPPRDARWMLELTAVRALAGQARRRADLGLTEATLEAAVHVLIEALRGGGCLTRGACVELLVDAGVHTAPEHGYHLLLYASQLGVTCMGPQEGKEQTFVLLDEWVPDPRLMDRDEALAVLALRYVRSHGPVTRHDLARWTGLTVGDATRAIALAGDELVPVEVGGTEMVVAAAFLGEEPTADPGVLLLPGFDEYMLGYKDRDAMLTDEQFEMVVPGRNGVFKPTLVVDGRVAGTWSRKVRAQHVDVVVVPFASLSKATRRGLDRAAGAYGEYLGLEARVSVADV